MVKISECVLLLHDYTFFTGKGIRSTTMSEYIGNYALMYAMDKQISKVHESQIHRNASNQIPFYEADSKLFRVYATPARLSNLPKWLKYNADIPKYIQSAGIYAKVSLTFNSLSTITNLTEIEKVNIPQIGKKEKFPPMTCFSFFAVGGQPYGIIRIGKKSASARIYSKSINSAISKKSGDYEPSHPLLAKDHENIIVYSGRIISQFPPLIVDCKANGEHYEFKNESGDQVKVAVPAQSRFNSVEQ